MTCTRNRCEEQGERDGHGNDQGAADVPEEQEEDEGHQKNTVREIAKDGVAGVANEIAAIEVGDEGNAGGQQSVVEFMNFGMKSIESSVSVCALAEQDDSLDDVVVVENSAVFAADGFA